MHCTERPREGRQVRVSQLARYLGWCFAVTELVTRARHSQHPQPRGERFPCSGVHKAVELPFRCSQPRGCVAGTQLWGTDEEVRKRC